MTTQTESYTVTAVAVILGRKDMTARSYNAWADFVSSRIESVESKVGYTILVCNKAYGAEDDFVVKCSGIHEWVIAWELKEALRVLWREWCESR